jgi:hypothetical protein
MNWIRDRCLTATPGSPPLLTADSGQACHAAKVQGQKTLSDKTGANTAIC